MIKRKGFRVFLEPPRFGGEKITINILHYNDLRDILTVLGLYFGSGDIGWAPHDLYRCGNIVVLSLLSAFIESAAELVLTL